MQCVSRHSAGRPVGFNVIEALGSAQQPPYRYVLRAVGGAILLLLQELSCAGPVPPGFGSMRLTELRITGNQLIGTGQIVIVTLFTLMSDFVDAGPLDWVVGLSQLQILVAGHNGFTGEAGPRVIRVLPSTETSPVLVRVDLGTLPDGLGFLPQLSVVGLHENLLGGKQWS